MTSPELSGFPARARHAWPRTGRPRCGLSGSPTSLLTRPPAAPSVPTAAHRAAARTSCPVHRSDNPRGARPRSPGPHSTGQTSRRPTTSGRAPLPAPLGAPLAPASALLLSPSAHAEPSQLRAGHRGLGKNNRRQAPPQPAGPAPRGWPRPFPGGRAGLLPARTSAGVRLHRRCGHFPVRRGAPMSTPPSKAPGLVPSPRPRSVPSRRSGALSVLHRFGPVGIAGFWAALCSLQMK